MMKLI